MSKPSSNLGVFLLAAFFAAGGLPTIGNRSDADFQRLELLAAGPSCMRAPSWEPTWVAIPAGTNWLGSRAGRAGEQPRKYVSPGFRLAATELTVGQFIAYLNAAGVKEADFPQVAGRPGQWSARVPEGIPMGNLGLRVAESYVKWLGERLGRVVRLPTEDEWEYAARAGVDSAPYPWGWEPPEGRACFAGDGPVKVRSFAPNRWGLYDMAGNLSEWCSPGDATRGGSWADRSADPLRVFHRITLPAAYRDADAGLRPLLEN